MTRRKNAKQLAQRSAAVGTVTHGTTLWPMYRWLIDHDAKVTVIALYDNDALVEVVTMVAAANRDCKHKSKPGPCLRIEAATKQEWVQTHS